MHYVVTFNDANNIVHEQTVHLAQSCDQTPFEMIKKSFPGVIRYKAIDFSTMDVEIHDIAIDVENHLSKGYYSRVYDRIQNVSHEIVKQITSLLNPDNQKTYKVIISGIL